MAIRERQPEPPKPATEFLLESDNLYKAVSSNDLTLMIKWSHIKTNDELFSPALGFVKLLRIDDEEPRIVTKDRSGGIHSFYSDGRLNKHGQKLLFPDKNKKWNVFYEQVNLPKTKELVESIINNEEIKNCYQLLNRLIVAAKAIDNFFESIFQSNSEHLFTISLYGRNFVSPSDDNYDFYGSDYDAKYGYYAYSVDRYAGYHPMSTICWMNLQDGLRDFLRFQRERNCEFSIGFEIKDKQTYIKQDIDFFAFNSLSAISYFVKLYKSELVDFYSRIYHVFTCEPKFSSEVLYEFSSISNLFSQPRPVWVLSYDSRINNPENINRISKVVEHIFEKDIFMEVRNHPRQRILSNDELNSEQKSSDLTKMVKWMGFEAGQRMYSPAYGYLFLDEIRPTEPKLLLKDDNNNKYFFSSQGKLFADGEVMLFPNNLCEWKPVKVTLDIPTKEFLDRKSDKSINMACEKLYRLKIISKMIDSIFSGLSFRNHHVHVSCTLCLKKDGSQNIASCMAIDYDNYYFPRGVFHLFMFQSYNALSYFVKLFKEDLEFVYSKLYDLKVNRWDIGNSLQALK